MDYRTHRFATNHHAGSGNHAPWRPRVLLSIAQVAVLLAGCAHPDGASRSGSVGDEPPPKGALALVTVASLPTVCSRVEAVGRALGMWHETPGDLWVVLRALLEDAVDPLSVVDWSRPLHALVLVSPLGRRSPSGKPSAVTPSVGAPSGAKPTVVWALPAAHPKDAVGRLARRCRSQREGAWLVARGGGRGVLPCRFFVRPLAGGIVVSPIGPVEPGVLRFLRAILRRRPLVSPRRSNLVSVRLFAPTLLARAGLTQEKVKQYIDLAALGLAMAAGDLTAGPEVKTRLLRLWELARSAAELKLTVDASMQRVSLALEIVGRAGGSLQRFARELSPTPMVLWRQHAARATAALDLAGSVHQGVMSPSPGSGGWLSLLLSRLPSEARAPAGALLTDLVGGSAETLVHVGASVSGQGLELGITRRVGDAAGVAGRVVKSLRTLLGLLASRAKPAAGDLRVALRHVGAVQRLEVTLPEAGTGALWRVLGRVAGGRSLVIAVASRSDLLVMRVGPDAVASAQRALGTRGIRAHAPPSHPDRARISGRLLVSLSRLAGTVMDEGESKGEGAAKGDESPKGGGGSSGKAPELVELRWGARPRARSLFVELRLPISQLRAAGRALSRLAESLGTQKGSALSSWLERGAREEPDDAL